MSKGKTKTYYHKHPIVVYVVYGLFTALLFACALFNLLKTMGVGKLESYYKGLEISAIIVPLLASIGLTIVLFSTSYVVGEGKFVHQKFFKKEYTADKLLTIKQDKKSGLTVLYVEDETKEDFVGFVVLQVSKSKIDELISDIRELNPHVSVEILNGKEQ